MYDILFKHLENKVSLTEEQKEIIKTFFVPKKIRKRQFLLQEGDFCKNLTFLTKGILRTYNFDSKGTEHISQFSVEGWWASDMYSYFTGEAATQSIDALEDSEILLLPIENFEILMSRVPVMDRYFRILFQNSLLTKEKRLLSNQIHTAEEKYTYFLSECPELSRKLPQNLIASYLGLTPETLSRLKKSILLNK